MRTRSLGLVLCAGLALSACATIHPARYSKDQAPAASACADWRWIGIKESSSAACPVPGRGWTVKPLFEVATKAPDCCSEQCKEVYGQQQQQQTRDQNGIATADAVDELKRFCVYEAADPWKTPSHPPFALPQAAGLVGLDRDCATISPASHELTEQDLVNLSTRFLHEAGAATAMRITKQRGVRLAFLDTEPTGVGVPPPPEKGSPRHGYTLAHMANRLVCSPEEPHACAALITTRLALPIRKFDPERRSGTDIDTLRGGGIGMQTDLAEAIEAEVNDWRNHLANEDAPQHLVLNLSLGWDPAQVEGLDADLITKLQTGTQAVYRALQYAKSLDVLVLAAAGNKRDCPVPSEGPLLPAAWESDAPMGRSPNSQTPLVYAVGGVGNDNSPLYNARDRGMPKRVAYGESGVLAAGEGEGFRSTWIYTGSSVATAVVSSAAAFVWDSLSEPNSAEVNSTLVGSTEVSSADVMDRVDASGESLTFTANFGYGAGAAVRKISVCKALLTACGSAPCVEELKGCPRPDADVAMEKVVVHYESSSSSTYCHPWVVPQPDDPLCPFCNVGP